MLVVLAGCSSYGVIANDPIKGDGGNSYALLSNAKKPFRTDQSLTLAFSGGGTRAAALSYGVLKALRSIEVNTSSHTETLLDSVDDISSVSGGSFTAAYYGLFGDKIFTDFEKDFIKRDLQGELTRTLFNPAGWFSSQGRTESAIQIYEKTIFKGAKFSDMNRPGAPVIMINASDLGYGVRFTFVQEYFDLLCSDLGSFSVARAVAASSAVPVLFNPMVVKNYSGCEEKEDFHEWMEKSRLKGGDDPELLQLVTGLDTYKNKDERQYAHFVDGGITDNLGLRAITDAFQVAGGTKPIFTKANIEQAPKRVVTISVDASTTPRLDMDRSNKQPSVFETMSAMSSVQLHRYNVSTINLYQHKIKQWAESISTETRKVEPYFIHLDFSQIEDAEELAYVNSIPTSFSLSDKQAETMIRTGMELLVKHPEFVRLLNDINGAKGQ